LPDRLPLRLLDLLVAAMVPMAMGKGPGAAARAGMAKVILGGQALSLLLTLLLTPVAYSLWDDLGRLRRRLSERLFGPRPSPAPVTPSTHAPAETVKS
jgi:HAE1 family hydrophobic/amphiphilic exporter-1